MSVSQELGSGVQVEGSVPVRKAIRYLGAVVLRPRLDRLSVTEQHVSRT